MSATYVDEFMLSAEICQEKMSGAVVALDGVGVSDESERVKEAGLGGLWLGEGWWGSIWM